MAFRALVAVLGGVLLAGAAHAASPLRVVVLLSDPTDDKVLTRMRGHASDLPVTFIAAHGRQDPSVSTNLTSQLGAVQALAGGQAADAVIWFSHGRCADAAGGGGEWMVVHVGQPQTHSVLVRTLGETDCLAEALPNLKVADSAILETAAIIIRGALLALSEGGTIGIAPAATAVPVVRARPTPPTAPTLLHPRVLVEWMAAADGMSSFGQQGLRTSLGMGGATFGAELTLLGTLPVAVTRTQGSVSLSRVGATLGGVVHLPMGDDWEFTGALQVGACLVIRSTSPELSTTVMAAPDAGRHPSFLVSPEGRLSWSVLGYQGVALVMTLGADVLPTTPVVKLTYFDTNGIEPDQIERRRPWVVQPRAAFGVEFRLP